MVGGDAAELGAGPGSYDIDRSVWHVNVSTQTQTICQSTRANTQKCCSPQLNGGGAWGILNALLGWTNSATYGSVISYNVYWAVVIAGFLTLRFHEKNGRYPFTKRPIKAEEGEAQPLLN